MVFYASWTEKMFSVFALLSYFITNMIFSSVVSLYLLLLFVTSSVFEFLFQPFIVFLL